MAHRTIRPALFIVCAATVLAPALVEAQQTLFVNNDAPVGGDGFTRETAFREIQTALDAASADDTILVIAGTYTGPSNRHLDFHGKSITLRSESGPDVTTIDCEQQGRGFFFHSGETKTSVVDGFAIRNGLAPSDERGGAILFLDSSPTVRNCTITNSSAPVSGGGLACERDASPTITDCVISGNTAGVRGGGIVCTSNSRPTIRDCTIRDNVADARWGAIDVRDDSAPILRRCLIQNNHSLGVFIAPREVVLTMQDCTIDGNEQGGIHIFDATATLTGCMITGNGGIGGVVCSQNRAATITNCVISANMAGVGAGVRCVSQGNATVRNCLIAGNRAEAGGGVQCDLGSTLVVEHCTISDNRAATGRGAAAQSGRRGSEISTLHISNCIVSERGDGFQFDDRSVVEISYTLVSGGYAGVGNLDALPSFVRRGVWDDAGTPSEPADDVFLIGDYHLLAGSAGINRGHPSFMPGENEIDLDREPRVQGGRVDMGPYESSWSLADFDFDFDVDLADYLEILRCVGDAGASLAPGCDVADFDGDGDVDLADHVTFQAQLIKAQ